MIRLVVVTGDMGNEWGNILSPKRCRSLKRHHPRTMISLSRTPLPPPPPPQTLHCPRNGDASLLSATKERERD